MRGSSGRTTASATKGRPLLSHERFAAAIADKYRFRPGGRAPKTGPLVFRQLERKENVRQRRTTVVHVHMPPHSPLHVREKIVEIRKEVVPGVRIVERERLVERYVERHLFEVREVKQMIREQQLLRDRLLQSLSIEEAIPARRMKQTLQSVAADDVDDVDEAPVVRLARRKLPDVQLDLPKRSIIAYAKRELAELQSAETANRSVAGERRPLERRVPESSQRPGEASRLVMNRGLEAGRTGATQPGSGGRTEAGRAPGGDYRTETNRGLKTGNRSVTGSGLETEHKSETKPGSVNEHGLETNSGSETEHRSEQGSDSMVNRQPGADGTHEPISEPGAKTTLENTEHAEGGRPEAERDSGKENLQSEREVGPNGQLPPDTAGVRSVVRALSVVRRSPGIHVLPVWRLFRRKVQTPPEQARPQRGRRKSEGRRTSPKSKGGRDDRLAPSKLPMNELDAKAIAVPWQSVRKLQSRLKRVLLVRGDIALHHASGVRNMDAAGRHKAAEETDSVAARSNRDLPDLAAASTKTRKAEDDAANDVSTSSLHGTDPGTAEPQDGNPPTEGITEYALQARDADVLPLEVSNVRDSGSSGVEAGAHERLSDETATPLSTSWKARLIPGVRYVPGAGWPALAMRMWRRQQLESEYSEGSGVAGTRSADGNNVGNRKVDGSLSTGRLNETGARQLSSTSGNLDGAGAGPPGAASGVSDESGTEKLQSTARNSGEAGVDQSRATGGISAETEAGKSQSVGGNSDEVDTMRRSAANNNLEQSSAGQSGAADEKADWTAQGQQRAADGSSDDIHLTRATAARRDTVGGEDEDKAIGRYVSGDVASQRFPQLLKRSFRKAGNANRSYKSGDANSQHQFGDANRHHQTGDAAALTEDRRAEVVQVKAIWNGGKPQSGGTSGAGRLLVTVPGRAFGKEQRIVATLINSQLLHALQHLRVAKRQADNAPMTIRLRQTRRWPEPERAGGATVPAAASFSQHNDAVVRAIVAQSGQTGTIRANEFGSRNVQVRAEVDLLYRMFDEPPHAGAALQPRGGLKTQDSRATIKAQRTEAAPRNSAQQVHRVADAASATGGRHADMAVVQRAEAVRRETPATHGGAAPMLPEAAHRAAKQSHAANGRHVLKTLRSAAAQGAAPTPRAEQGARAMTARRGAGATSAAEPPRAEQSAREMAARRAAAMSPSAESPRAGQASREMTARRVAAMSPSAESPRAGQQATREMAARRVAAMSPSAEPPRTGPAMRALSARRATLLPVARSLGQEPTRMGTGSLTTTLSSSPLEFSPAHIAAPSGRAMLVQRSTSSQHSKNSHAEASRAAVLSASASSTPLEMRRESRTEPKVSEKPDEVIAHVPQAVDPVQLKQALESIPQFQPDKLAEQVYQVLMKRIKLEQRLQGY